MKEEELENFDLEKENPWAISTTLKDFLYFCCPECDDKKQSEISFVAHALLKHPKASKYLQKYVNESVSSGFLVSNKNVKEEEEDFEQNFEEETFNYDNDWAESFEDENEIDSEAHVKIEGLEVVEKHVLESEMPAQVIRQTSYFYVSM